MSNVTDSYSWQEKRIWTVIFSMAFVYTVCLLLGGFWMYNQWNVAIKTQDNMIDLTKFMNDRFVDKDLLAAYVAQQNKRYDDIDNKLDRINDKTEIIQKYLSNSR